MSGIDNLYAPRSMLAALKMIFRPNRFLINTFFRTVETHETESFDIDIVKGSRRLAPFVAPRLAGKVIEKDGYVTKNYKPPYIKELDVTMAHHALIRRPGEMLYDSGMTPEQRAMEMLMEEMLKLDDMISRREEAMAAQALTTGHVIAKGDGINDDINFGFTTQGDGNQLPALTGTAKWSDLSNATPIKNFRQWKMVGSKKGKNMNVAVMNSATAEYLLGNLKEVVGTNNVFNTNQVALGKIDPTQLADGVTYIGRINGIGLDIYAYDEWYINEANVLVSMIPDGKVIMGSTAARATLHYGVIQDLDALSNAAVTRFPFSWVENNPKARMLSLQAAPLPVIHEIDAFLCATVL